MPTYMIKYGKEEHLRQIVDGNLRFTPSQSYIKIEKELNNKGQGDLLEGKIKLRASSAQLCDIDTGQSLQQLPSIDMIMSVADVNNMPVFCISAYEIKDTVDYVDDCHYKININKDNLERIKKDFEDATHALIVLEPDKFINSVIEIDNANIIGDNIHYYDYSINPVEMMMYLTTGEETIKTNTHLSFYDEDKYRLLLCKDNFFAQQQEYRFVKINEYIDKPKKYDFNFNSKFAIVPISKLETPLDISEII